MDELPLNFDMPASRTVDVEGNKTVMIKKPEKNWLKTEKLAKNQIDKIKID